MGTEHNLFLGAIRSSEDIGALIKSYEDCQNCPRNFYREIQERIVLLIKKNPEKNMQYIFWASQKRILNDGSLKNLAQTALLKHFNQRNVDFFRKKVNEDIFKNIFLNLLESFEDRGILLQYFGLDFLEESESALIEDLVGHKCFVLHKGRLERYGIREYNEEYWAFLLKNFSLEQMKEMRACLDDLKKDFSHKELFSVGYPVEFLRSEHDWE
jgi:hypothetical protein